MRLIFYFFNEILIKIDTTALLIAIQQENIEIVKLLLTNENIDISNLNI